MRGIAGNSENLTGKKGNNADSSQNNIDNKIPFLITSSYLLSFLTIRILVIIAGSVQSPASQAAKAGEIRFYLGTNIILFGYHIHHLFIGIFLIALAGWLSITGRSRLTRGELAIIYGIGLGLFMDEVGLLLSWGDYWSATTYILSLLLAGIFLNIIYFPSFWSEVRGHLVYADPRRLAGVSNDWRNALVRGVDRAAEEASDTDRVAAVFSGLIYTGAALLIIAYPALVYYWIAGGFLLQGVSALARAWKT